MIVDNIKKHTSSIDDVKGLGFCVSVEHAKYMESFFEKKGIKAMHLSGKTKSELRRDTKKKLVSGEINFVFVVDLYNEGVDIPEINTVLFLRPTESLTVFLQQLGRGLRLSENKDCLTVFDFVGQANEKYDFESKFRALLSITRNSVEKEIESGFVNLPKGCYINLEKKAQEYIIDNINKAISKRSGLKNRIETFEADTGKSLNLKNFVSYYRIDLEEIYSKGNFSRLCVEAKAKEDFFDKDEDVLTRGMARLCKIDSVEWIRLILKVIKGEEVEIDEVQEKMIMMLNYTLWMKTFDEMGFENIHDVIEKIKKNTTLVDEIVDLLEVKLNEIDFVDSKVELGFKHGLYLHCKYSRDQILAGLGENSAYRKVPSREGVYYIKDKNIDVFFITLNKSEKDYSPTTMYNDYAINEFLFHWQSQSNTSDESPTGKRYISGSSKVIFFIREYKKQLYTFLGTAKYVSHEGSKPISIIFKLNSEIPAKHLQKVTKAV